MRNYFIRTGSGQIVFCAQEAVMRGEGPFTLLIHGAFRSARTLSAWADRVTNPVFANLPGHGGAPALSDASLATWTQAMSEGVQALRRPVLAVGESLGGLIALGLPVGAAVAVDPFFETDKLWPLRFTERAAAERGHPSPAAALLAPGHVYFSQLDLGRTTPDIITGDIPLGDPRRLDRTPCLMDEADVARIGDRARIHRISGGHNLMDDNPDSCRAIIHSAYERLTRALSSTP